MPPPPPSPQPPQPQPQPQPSPPQPRGEDENGVTRISTFGASSSNMPGASNFMVTNPLVRSSMSVDTTPLVTGHNWSETPIIGVLSTYTPSSLTSSIVLVGHEPSRCESTPTPTALSTPSVSLYGTTHINSTRDLAKPLPLERDEIPPGTYPICSQKWYRACCTTLPLLSNTITTPAREDALYLFRCSCDGVLVCRWGERWQWYSIVGGLLFLCEQRVKWE